MSISPTSQTGTSPTTLNEPNRVVAGRLYITSHCALLNALLHDTNLQAHSPPGDVASGWWNVPWSRILIDRLKGCDPYERT